MKLSGRQASSRATDAACLAALGVLWVVMALLAKPVGDFPINDDWVYGLSVKALLETGRFSLPSPASTNLLPQAYWGALFCLPFGFSFTALRISTLVLGLIGVVATACYRGGLAVSLRVDDESTSSPTPAKRVLTVVVGLALLATLVLLAITDRAAPWPAPRSCTIH